ncbi:aldo/keto reductase [Dyadobacter sp. CY326]|nr:aldo/keto reductase [Dyadobacter sp. CY326]
MTTSQLALAWILAQKPWIAPIPGTTKLHRLEENIGSTNIVLTTDEIAKINTTVNGITLVGDRYPEVLEKQIDRS